MTLRRLESAVADLLGAAGPAVDPAVDPAVGPPVDPVAVARQEEIADRVVDLLAARAAAGVRPAPPHAVALCLDHVLATDAANADAARAGAGAGGARPADRHGLSVRALTALADAAAFDGAVAHIRRLAGERPDGRLRAAWLTCAEALGGLDRTRHEWVGTDPACAAAVGWVLVDRIGRLHATAALIAAAVATPPGEADITVNAARRYAWNHLRLPAPEAATAVHVRRSADLVAWLVGGRS